MQNIQMADNNTEDDPKLVEEIADTVNKMVAKGSFYSACEWNKSLVVIKTIRCKSSRDYNYFNNFEETVKILSGVKHPNVIKLFGLCKPNNSENYLVIEMTEGRSLDKILFCKPEIEYNLGHTVNWISQLAKGLAYLHKTKPNPIILKYLAPSNLLIMNAGVTLKICNFGTDCEKNSYVTIENSCAPWIAPEIFTNVNESNHTEKCDVYSLGIILWQVLTRQRPYEYDTEREIFSIMQAVAAGTRPKMTEQCPKKFQELITMCWDPNPRKRPSMDYVVIVLRIFAKKLF